MYVLVAPTVEGFEWVFLGLGLLADVLAGVAALGKAASAGTGTRPRPEFRSATADAGG